MVGYYVHFSDNKTYIVTKELGDDILQVYNPVENLKKAVAKKKSSTKSDRTSNVSRVPR
ncbi:MAG: hypothetical protein AB3A66_27205 (plasmid) [Nodularia sp. CChRGM 3473]